MPLQHRILLLQQTQQLSAAGEAVGAWNVFKTLWADVRPARGAVPMVYGAAVDQPQIEIEIRRRADVLTEQRIAWRGQLYRQTAPAVPSGLMHRFLKLYATGMGRAYLLPGDPNAVPAGALMFNGLPLMTPDGYYLVFDSDAGPDTSLPDGALLYAGQPLVNSNGDNFTFTA